MTGYDSSGFDKAGSKRAMIAGARGHGETFMPPTYHGFGEGCCAGGNMLSRDWDELVSWRR